MNAKGWDDLPADLVRKVAAFTPLWQGVFVLKMGTDLFALDYLSCDAIETALEQMGLGTTALQVRNAFASGGEGRVKSRPGKCVSEFRLLLQGKDELELLLSDGPVDAIFIEGNTPRRAKKELAEIFSDFSGEVRILDTYYGERSFDSLELLDPDLHVKFLSKTTREKKSKLTRVYSDFRAEYSNFEFRVVPSQVKLHDRYILTDNEIIIIGHGIKDLGHSQSFIICLDRSVAFDLINSVRASFDLLWDQATPY